ncbi:hypothetical protein L915_11978 [Plasmopara halstedii]|uniref:EF-hand domain-containing protein n=1 Tax=Plasmopara halstedii TaxID=4781 RepID=A0A0P1A6C1_PLAHL|nr:hypothetical protein L915_11978 [Plasmopara halstedii]CEG35709.1 hypothetical protein L915_11978 [Plasmopara halstedii]|eukprot:XP_024572078.1 hypothetical protein L915_11978 [Plasmopara halstedii]
MAQPGEFLTNLTLDGVREGAYMLCKHSDDLLGHHARQIFREKAASMRAENSIYYYLKDLMKKFGSQQHVSKIKKIIKGEPQQLVLEEHEFRKLIASDPAFESAVPNDQVDALFHRLECDDCKLLLHRDFVEFCLLDQDQLRLLLFKYRKHLKSLDLTDIEIADTFKRLASPDGTAMAPELFHTAIMRDVDVVLTTGELAFVMNIMDSDQDGLVKLNDLESLLKDEKKAEELIHPALENGVVELKISTNNLEEMTLQRGHYIQLHPNLQNASGSCPMYLWFRKAAREEGKAAISNIKLASSSRDTELVSKGYTCLQQDISKGGTFGKHKYIWTSLVPSSAQMTNELVDLSLTSGDLSDENSARLWLPRHRGFKLVAGNFIQKSNKHGVFLWIRRRQTLLTDLAEPSILNHMMASPRTRTSVHRHCDDLESQVRKCLRRNCPIDQDCSLNFSRLFDEFDPKRVRAITKQAVLAGIETLGLKMDKKDFRLVWERINPFGAKLISLGTFTQFLELTDSEIDDLVNSLQRTMTTRFGSSVPNYRLIFQSYNALGDGKLSRSDFQRIFATNQLSFTNSELSKVIQRFDVNKDGFVDYSDFLSYVTGVCDASARAARRIAEAADDFRVWALENQNKKLAKDGILDSASAWRLLKPKHGRLDSMTINHVLRQRSRRLTEDQIFLLQVLIAPSTNGEVNQAAFHAFINHVPKKIPTVVYELQKLVGSEPLKSGIDKIYNRLNIEANGKLALVKLSQQLNALAVENLTRQVDLKDLVYVVQFTGACCGGDGAVLLDRFLSGIRENQDRRNMKSEFGTHYDSPQFLEGVNLLRDEIKRCAKTPDGKFDYMIPFRIFDKDRSGHIVLSEFEAAIRELGVNKYLNDQEIKGLMRRFDPNLSGAINFNEFLRFSLAESSSSSNRRLNTVILPNPNLQRILDDIVINERLTNGNAEAFCGSLKRMFIIIDKDTTGLVPFNRFVETLQEMSIAVPKADMDVIKTMFGDGKGTENVQYERFCEAITQKCQHYRESQPAFYIPASEILNLLETLHQQFTQLEPSIQGSDIYKAFGVENNMPKSVYVSVDDLKDVLWAVGVHHPYLREELEVIKISFQLHQNSEFDVALFQKFLSDGPRAFLAGTSYLFDNHIKRLSNELFSFLSSEKDAGVRLFSLFPEVDTNLNGIMSKDEFLHLLQKAGVRKFFGSEDEKLLLQFLKGNGDEALSYADFISFAKQADQKLKSLADEQSDTLPCKSQSDEAPYTVIVSPTIADKTSAGNTSSSIIPPQHFEQPHALLLRQIGKLNRLLRPQFPFATYFSKYRLDQNETRVTVQIFEKIINKFLDRLVIQRVVYNMKNMDIELLIQSYTVTSDEGAYIDYELFLGDFAKTQESIAAASADHDISTGESDDELSCSSDEESCITLKVSKSIGPVLLQAIKHVHKTPAELHALKSLVNTLSEDLSARKQFTVSETKIYKLLTTLSLRLRNTDVIKLFTCIKTELHGRTVFEVEPFIAAIKEQIDIAIGPQKEAPATVANVDLPPVEVKPIPAATTASSSLLEPVLAKKIYRCFLAAAQHNISGRKLLEKCDTAGTGTLTLLEFQTVLRLMGCRLTDSELEAVKTALGHPMSAQINYNILVQQMRPDSPQPRTAQKKSTEAFQASRSADKFQHNSMKPSSVSHSHHFPAQFGPKAVCTNAPTSFEEAKRVDNFVGHFFSELLNVRRIDSATLYHNFELYDIKSTGFIFIDAFSAVMRKLNIFLPSDVATTVISRFTSVVKEKFDYIDFCQVVATFLQPKSPPPRMQRGVQASRTASSSMSDPKAVRPEASQTQTSRKVTSDKVTIETPSRQNNEVDKQAVDVVRFC